MAYWDKLRGRGSVEDRRAAGPVALGGLGTTGILLVVVFNLLSGGNPTDSLNQVLDQLQQSQASQQTDTGQFAGADSYETFASTVLGSNNEVWDGIFAQSAKEYVPPKLVLFRNATQSGCGTATSDVGPHYCPADKTIYLDETFFQALESQLGAKGGDVAEAYVIAHEAGHHVQNQLGIMSKVYDETNGEIANALSVKLELQADCFAGIWAYSVAKQGVFEEGEINEALDAAAAVGDDRIQKKMNGTVNPETWTHGSSAERMDWFNRGYKSGTPKSCETFAN
jgi:predicted metalloprotease